jgi:hypothetical protein
VEVPDLNDARASVSPMSPELVCYRRFSNYDATCAVRTYERGVVVKAFEMVLALTNTVRRCPGFLVEALQENAAKVNYVCRVAGQVLYGGSQ